MLEESTLPRYDVQRTYRWNYDHAPDPPAVAVPEAPGEWSFLGRPVGSPLGIPAGPLLNGKWILYYAALGFDVLTYKTVRSGHRECYALPNLQPVDARVMKGDESAVAATDVMNGSWAVSFGMPSMSPEVWRRDIERTRKLLPAEKVLSVSVVGTVQSGWTLEDLAADYAQCARWALDSGADCIETNFSCPNVSTRDGQLYQQAEAAATVAAKVRDRTGADTPYIAKIGHVRDEASASDLIDAVSPYLNALAMTNSVPAHVRGADGQLLFDGQSRGICGDATRDTSVEQVRLFSRLIAERGIDMKIIGVGGVSSAAHVRRYLDAGAHAVHIATAAMVDPMVGVKIRAEL